MFSRKLFPAICGALIVSASTCAFAQSSDADSRSSRIWGWDDPSGSRPTSWLPYTSYGYVGAGIGRSKYNLGNCAPGFSCDDTDIGYKVFTGGQVSRILGLELGYVYLGRGEASGGDVKAQGVNLSLIGNLPIGEMFNVYAKVGGIYGWTHTSASPAAGVSNGNDHGLNFSYGAGVQVDLTRNWAVQADWDHYRFDFAGGSSNAQLYSINAVYKF